MGNHYNIYKLEPLFDGQKDDKFADKFPIDNNKLHKHTKLYLYGTMDLHHFNYVNDHMLGYEIQHKHKHRGKHDDDDDDHDHDDWYIKKEEEKLGRAGGGNQRGCLVTVASWKNSHHHSKNNSVKLYPATTTSTTTENDGSSNNQIDVGLIICMICIKDLNDIYLVEDHKETEKMEEMFGNLDHIDLPID